ncbi:uncharacterized protein AMSG_04878 [Thecamonas trahens ATCC 50062]|uniref:DUF7630 domain-containing protein n=1 Tax=Thecamonas trahens ATCC 50062 TaxID=461836 RepID=A0A0L0D8M0_THETB|nr:hypothetical protein AMSG_04878 [Thecamonas trahens ATCC 50062]KNC48431.1 hypothetical protein AMSG_04878 [Thecamonas trahens ATCC 50062]|eukprot:XP_013758546.1 hypothetical protein AMSG_04878 [Thecamonas trahens ATCC 50062]
MMVNDAAAFGDRCMGRRLKGRRGDHSGWLAVVMTVVATLAVVVAVANGQCLTPLAESAVLVDKTTAINDVMDRVTGVGVGDFNNDGFMDIAGCGEKAVFVIMGKNTTEAAGVPQFETRTIVEASDRWRTIAVGDMDNDNTTDLMASNNGDGVFVWFSDGNVDVSWTKVMAIGDTPVDSGKFFYFDIADADGDGDLDVVAGMGDQQNVRVAINLGSRVFAPATDVGALPAVPQPGTGVVRFVDVDDDALIDLLVVGGEVFNSALFLLKASAPLTWGAPQELVRATTGESVGNPLMFDVGDFNSDGSVDIAVIFAKLTGELTMFLNDGTGVFSQQPTVVAGKRPKAIKAVDIDGDGLLDLAVGSGSGGTNLFGMYNLMTAGEPSTFSIGATVVLMNDIDLVTQIGVVDMNFDGAVDFVANSEDQDEIWLKVNTRLANQLPVKVVESSAPSTRVKLLDGDTDGDLDMMVALDGLGAANGNDLGVGMYENSNGDGAFVAPKTVFVISNSTSGSVSDYCATDFNGDGVVDWLILHGTQGKTGPGAYLKLVLSSQGETVSAAANQVPPGYGEQVDLTRLLHPVRGYLSSGGVECVDLDADGDVDFLVTARHEQKVFWIENTDGSVEGLQAFSSDVVAGPSVSNAGGIDVVRVGDMNGDGHVDLVYGATEVDTLVMMTGTGLAGAGMFNSYTVLYNGTVFMVEGLYTGGKVISQGIADVLPVDIDSDGDLDLVVGDSCCRNNDALGLELSFEPAWLYMENLDGGTTFGLVKRPGVLFTKTVATLDANLDGNADVVLLTEFLSKEVVLELGDGSGGFTRTVLVSGNELSGTMAIGDIDGNGLLDFAFAGRVGSGVVSVFKRSTVMIRFPPPADMVTVDVGGCGYRMACVAVAIGESPRCTSRRVVLPPGVYTGCFAVAPITIAKKIEIVVGGPAGTRATIDCRASGGVLFHVVEGGKLSLSNLDVVGTSQAPKSAFGSTALRVSDGGELELRAMSFADSFPRPDASYPLFGLFLGGYGGAVAVETGGTLTAMHSNFTRVRALQSGGAIAALGEQPRVTLSDCLFVGCSAANGGGGAVYVEATKSAIVTLERCKMRDNVARAGGALFAALDASSVTVSASTIEGNSATWGGAVATSHASQAERFLSSLALGTLPLVSSAASGSGVTLTSTVVSGNSATYGGTFALCEESVFVDGGSTVADSRASRCGGVAFECGASGVARSPQLASLAWLTGAGVSSIAADAGSAGLFGPQVCSGPVAIGFAQALRESLPAGNRLGSAPVFALDAFGQDVVDPATNVEIGIVGSEASSFELKDADRSAVLGPGGVDFGLLTLVPTFPVESLADLGRNVTLRVGGESVISAFGAMASVVVSGCPAGQGGGSRAVDGLFACSLCSAFQSSTVESVAPCSGCPPGQFRDEGSAGCISCPRLSAQVLDRDDNSSSASTLLELCECVAGAYSPSGRTGVPCDECPQGGRCAGGVARPVAAFGFFDVSPGSVGTKFARCPREEACVGGLEVCNPKYTGYMCRECVAGYYSDSDKRCRKCPSQAYVPLVMFFMLLVAIAFGVVGLTAYAHVQFDSDEDVRKSQRQRKIPHSFTLAIVFFQILGMVGNQQFNWPSSVSRTLAATNVVNLDVNIFASECSLVSFDGKYLVSILYPLMFMGAVCVALVLFKLLRASLPWCTQTFPDLPLVQLLERIVFLMGSLLYIPLSRSSLLLFDCVKLPDGKFYLDADLGRRCYDSAWFTLMPWGMLAVLVYIVAVPVYFGFTLFRHRHELFQPAVLARYGSIYRLYRVRFYYFELVQLFKRLVVVFCSLFVSNHQTWLVALLLAVFLTSAFAQLRYEPYYHPIYNTLEIQLNVIISVVVMLGFVFYADLFKRAWSRQAFIGLTLAVIFGSLVLVIATMVVEIRSILKQVTGQAQFIHDVRVQRFWRVVEHEAPDWSDPSLRHQLMEVKSHFIADEQASKAEFERRRDSTAITKRNSLAVLGDDGDGVDDGILLGDVDASFFQVESP